MAMSSDDHPSRPYVPSRFGDIPSKRNRGQRTSLHQPGQDARQTSTPAEQLYRLYPTSAGAIRVIALKHADNPDDPFRASMSLISLNRRDENHKTCYTALSYAWGTYRQTTTISVDGVHIPVSENLHAALRRIRESHSDDLVLWIDAICINQHDPVEKGHQVAMMGDIYAQCSCLIIWLGDPVKNEWNELLEATTKRDWEIQVRRLLSVPYFRRRWVIQEAMRANFRCQRFLRGNVELSLHDFLSRLPESDFHLDVTAPLLHDVATQGLQIQHQRSLLENLFRYRKTECSEPHDSIYSLLGVSVDTDVVPIDYTMRVESLYILLAQHWARHNIIALLVSATANRPRKFPSPVPSWVPFWHSPKGPANQRHAEVMEYYQQDSKTEYTWRAKQVISYHGSHLYTWFLRMRGWLFRPCHRHTRPTVDDQDVVVSRYRCKRYPRKSPCCLMEVANPDDTHWQDLEWPRVDQFEAEWVLLPWNSAIGFVVSSKSGNGPDPEFEAQSNCTSYKRDDSSSSYTPDVPAKASLDMSYNLKYCFRVHQGLERSSDVNMLHDDLHRILQADVITIG